MSKYPKLILISFILAGPAVAAQAKEISGNDASSISQAAIPLTQAVKVATDNSGGKATHAEYEQTKQGPAFDVEVVKGDQTWDVRVDAETGQLISSVKDVADHDDQNDEID
ncbi:PepSY domain-containing protein [Modicisalibacter zincidurans]|uniref:PepSY domain-containing protein n=1 Tax=Modicisalibacter zincidurans TaxID=1178777 RepID=A0ABP9RFG4_9GAMM|nr:PepSY domain-containing protein [Halomonas zincidurans]